MEKSNVIIISDLLETKHRKERELQFYSEELEKLKSKMFWLKKEIKLTEDIIEMIKREKIVDIKDFVKKEDRE